MASVYELHPGKTVRRAAPTTWTPEMAAAYARLHPKTRVEHDGEPMGGVQLELFQVHHSMVESARWFTYRGG
jgi:hypothetical protein